MDRYFCQLSKIMVITLCIGTAKKVKKTCSHYRSSMVRSLSVPIFRINTVSPKLNVVTRNGYTFRGNNFVKIKIIFDSLLPEKECTLTGKNLLPLGANSFLLEYTSFNERQLVHRRAKLTGSHKSYLPCKNGGKSSKSIKSP